jgi:uncharacterized damage-inducible protein DinB
MSELPRIAAEIKRMYAGEPWHGPGVLDVLTDVTAAQAAARPIASAHSIYELTHHMAAWIGEVLSRLRGNPTGDPADGDFPPPDDHVDDQKWRDTVDRLSHRHEELIEAVNAFDASRLDDTVDPSWKKESGLPVTYYAMLHGIVQHDAYHAGQIKLLRKAVESRC